MQTSHAKALLEELARDGGTSAAHAAGFAAMVEQLRRQRPAVRGLQASNTQRERRRRRAAVAKEQPWRLPESIWGPRASWADSGDFYDTDDVKRRALDQDWGFVANTRGTVKLINKMGGGHADPVAAVREVFERNFNTVYGLFDLYSAQSDATFALTLNAFLLFVKEADLADPLSEEKRPALRYLVII